MYKRLFATFIFIAYCAVLVKLLVFKAVSFRIGHLMLNFSGGGTGPANFVPFRTILPYLLGEKGSVIAFFELAGNIGLLVPVGFIAPFVFKNMTWKKTLLLALAAGLVLEGMQVVLRVGIFDIDDVILNALGVMIGYWIFILLAKWARFR